MYRKKYYAKTYLLREAAEKIGLFLVARPLSGGRGGWVLGKGLATKKQKKNFLYNFFKILFPI